MKSKIKAAFLSAFLVAFVFICVFAHSVGAAENKLVAVEGVAYNVNTSMVDNLKSLAGKLVFITLDSGKTLTGTIKAVGDHLVHIEKLEGKEYFDALIIIQKIQAIDTRFREFQR